MFAFSSNSRARLSLLSGAVDAIELRGVVVEERALLGRRHVGGDPAEVVPDVVELHFQAGDGPVGGEDRALRAEALDAVHDHGATLS